MSDKKIHSCKECHLYMFLGMFLWMQGVKMFRSRRGQADWKITPTMVVCGQGVKLLI